MSGLFGNLTSDGLEESQDRLGGFTTFDSDIYKGKIKVAYAGKSDGGARNVTLVIDFSGKEYRETVYVTSKKGENFYMTKSEPPKKAPLPGFTTIDDICLAVTGKTLSDQDSEEKVVKIWDFDASAELPKNVPVLTELTGQDVCLGILKILENKSEKQGDEYVVTADTREINIIDKVFHAEKRFTVAEARQGLEAPVFYDKWLEKNKGNTVDRRKLKDGQGGTSGKPGGAAPKAGETSAPKKSLFS